MNKTDMIQKYAFIAFFLFNFFFCNLSKAQEEYGSQLKDRVILSYQKTINQTDTIYLAMFLKFLNQDSKQEESAMFI
ncbi:MAG: hypothetical protein FWF72_00425 [Paludibacter sp.]|nr:hypothetical protein [Paludibacter sp.]